MSTLNDSNSTSVRDNTLVEVIGADGTAIGNINDRLKVDVSSSSPTSLSKNIKIGLNVGDIIITAISYTTLLSVSGGGSLLGVQLGFDNTHAMVKLVVDGITTLEINFDDIKSLDFETDASNMKNNGGLLFTTKGNTFNINFPYPINYGSSFSLSVKSSDANNHKNKFWFVSYTKDS